MNRDIGLCSKCTNYLAQKKMADLYSKSENRLIVGFSSELQDELKDKSENELEDKSEDVSIVNSPFESEIYLCEKYGRPHQYNADNCGISVTVYNNNFEEAKKGIDICERTKYRSEIDPDEFWDVNKNVTKSFVINTILSTFNDIDENYLEKNMFVMTEELNQCGWDFHQNLQIKFSVKKYNQKVLESNHNLEYTNYFVNNFLTYYDQELLWDFQFDGCSLDEKYYFGVKDDVKISEDKDNDTSEIITFWGFPSDEPRDVNFQRFPEASMNFKGNSENWYIYKKLLLPITMSTLF